MSVYDTICIVAAIAVFISMFNHRFGKFQTTIAITGWSMIIAFSIMLLGKMGW
ncbi:hypothetical protein [Photobacterium damselae]|uniref:hypothetical protein n=1 Tax=Photobacterium damselae TaxID=38293 RepID=UPI0021593A09|nr:hypothetical protein [Photobacterium damselae]